MVMAASARYRPVKRLLTLLLLLLLLASIAPHRGASGAGLIGVNWGELGDNLPPPAEVVKLLKAQGIQHVKMFFSNPPLLQALAGSGITVVVGLANTAIPSIAANVSAAQAWLEQNVVPYPDTNITYVAVGNEVLAAKAGVRNRLVPAIHNLYAALQSLNLHLKVKLSTPMALNILYTSYPPSAGAFTPGYVDSVFRPLLDFYNKTGAGFMANAYPYFSYVGDTAEIPLAYAVFEPNPGVVDPANGKRYDNLLDAQLDAVFSAMKRLGYDNVGIIVGETGWPSKGDPAEVGCSVQIASTFNTNLVKYMQAGVGTPLHPNASVDVYIFGLFNENQKKGKTSERNYGLFYPDGQPVYPIDFRYTPAPAYPPALPPPPSNSFAPPAPATAPPPTTVLPPLPPPPPPAVAPLPAGSPPPQPPESGHQGDAWCIATASADPTALQQALDWACGEGGADCSPLQMGQPCFLPNSLASHANYAFNSYFQRQNRAGGSCFFGSTAYITSEDPSYADCKFPL